MRSTYISPAGSPSAKYEHPQFPQGSWGQKSIFAQHPLPSPPQQQHDEFPASYRHQHSVHTPLSPAASDDMMSPADSSSIWMQSETSLPIHIQTSNPESAPAMFVENIFHAPGAAAGHHPHIHASTGAYGYPMAMKTRSTGINMMSSVFPQDQERPRQRKKRQMTTPEDAQYQCNKCGKLFKREWNFSKHEETHDPNRPRPHICSYGNCKDAFARRTDLVRHMNGVHLKKKDFSCHRCGEGFARKDTLRRHEDGGCRRRPTIARRSTQPARAFTPQGTVIGPGFYMPPRAASATAMDYPTPEQMTTSPPPQPQTYQYNMRVAQPHQPHHPQHVHHHHQQEIQGSSGLPPVSDILTRQSGHLSEW